jgi:hypothetical protein
MGSLPGRWHAIKIPQLTLGVFLLVNQVSISWNSIEVGIMRIDETVEGTAFDACYD